jgi:phage shock protein E
MTKLTLILTTLAFSQFILAETIWLDVRSTDEYQQSHVENAIHIPHKLVEEKAPSLLPDKNANIKVYCAAGYRAMLAKRTLDKLGYKRVENVVSLSNAKRIKEENQ